MHKIVFISVILTSCSPFQSSSNYPPSSPPRNRPVNPEPDSKPDPTMRYHYTPEWLSKEWTADTWYLSGGAFGNYGILPGEEPIADSMFRYWEGIRSSWTKTINHGVIPTEYLSRVPSGPANIQWIDNTKGTISGFEKLPATFDVLFDRCPSLRDPGLQAPLIVAWATDKDIIRAGQFWDNWFKLKWDYVSNSVQISANTNLRPTINIRAEYIKDYGNGHSDGYKVPFQTFKEQTSGKSYADGGRVIWAIDQTFAHEYGHFLIQAWALNHGRSNIQSQWFAEGFAELFRNVCWGSNRDDPEWIRWNIEHETRGSRPFETWENTYRIANHRFARENEYDLLSLGDLITWEKFNKRFDTDKFFQAMINTLKQMEGRTIQDYPVISPIDGHLTTTAPWTTELNFQIPSISKDASMMLTRQEFLEKFCDNYPCGELEFLLKADVDGLKRDEW